jgi:hypothetical protein
MKFIKSSNSPNEERNQYVLTNDGVSQLTFVYRGLSAEIHYLQTKLGLHSPIGFGLASTLSIDANTSYLRSLEVFYEAYTKANLLDIKQETVQAKPIFHLFPDLPIELRIKIWKYALSSDIEARVHCIREVKSHGKTAFISNLSVSPLIHTTRESRSISISETRSEFAFETYINLDRDTIFFPGLGNTKTTYPDFLTYADTSKIQKLAWRKTGFHDIIMYEDLEKFQPLSRLLTNLSSLREISTVFLDEAHIVEIGMKDASTKFRDLSAREKRKKIYPCGEVRRIAAMIKMIKIERHSIAERKEKLSFRFVTVDDI